MTQTVTGPKVCDDAQNTYLTWLASVFAPELMLWLSIMLMSPGTATHLQHSEQGQIAHSNIPSTDTIK